jgi:hypothetical protein
LSGKIGIYNGLEKAYSMAVKVSFSRRGTTWKENGAALY